MPDEDDIWEYRHARRRGSESSYRPQRPNQFYPIYVDDSGPEVKIVRAGKSVSFDDLPLGQKPPKKRVEGLRPIWPVDKEGHHRCWGFIAESMQTYIDRGDVLVGKYHPEQDTWTLKYRVPKKYTRKHKTVWWDSRHDAGTHGTELVRKQLGQPGLFPFPKSVYAVRDCLDAVVRDRPNALIVDFFAGSGTTFHATCLLNSEDGGHRRSILVTNNEVSEDDARKLNEEGYFHGDPEFERRGIFEQVTKPRCDAVLTGRRPDKTSVSGKHLDLAGEPRGRPFKDGFEENIDFYRLDYLDPDEVDLGRQYKAIVPTLWLGAGAVGEREQEPKKGAWYSLPNEAKYAVLFRESRFERFREALKKRPEVTHVWLVTDSEDAFAEMRSALPRHLRVGMLYRDYLSNFAINTDRNVWP